MEQSPKPNSPLDPHNMREMAVRNSVEKLEYEKRQRIIEKQRTFFVRQHSRDENEIKQILMRLQHEQQIQLPSRSATPPNTVDREESARGTTNDFGKKEVVNPYPLVIMPKFGSPTPLKGKPSDEADSSMQIKGKAVDYENRDNRKTTTFRATVIAASFINKLHAPIAARKKLAPVKDIDGPMWVGDPQYISSIRRPRKSVAELSHHKMIHRSKSDVHVHHEHSILNTSSSFGSLTSSLQEINKEKNESKNSEGYTKADDVEEIIPGKSNFTSPCLTKKHFKEYKMSDKNYNSNKSKLGTKVSRSLSFTFSNNKNLSGKNASKNPKSKCGENISDGHVRKSSLKKKKDGCDEKPKKISFAEDVLPQRTGSLKERTAKSSSRQRSLSTGSSPISSNYV